MKAKLKLGQQFLSITTTMATSQLILATLRWARSDVHQLHAAPRHYSSSEHNIPFCTPTILCCL